MVETGANSSDSDDVERRHEDGVRTAVAGWNVQAEAERCSISRMEDILGSWDYDILCVVVVILRSCYGRYGTIL